MSGRGRAWVLPASVLLALLLGLLPMPALLQPLRPYWLALVLAYWVIEDSERVGLGFAFAVAWSPTSPSAACSASRRCAWW